MHKFTKSVIEISSKVQESKTYDEVINNLINENRWCKAVNKELLNLDAHQTWNYTPFPNNQKAIRYKWVFSVKYNSNGSIKKYKARLIV